MSTTIKTIKTVVIPVTAAAALLASTGCFSTNDRTAGRVMDDRNITGKVQSKLSHAPVYKFEDVKVITHNGVVQLSGWATTEEQKNRAGELARSVEGVDQVINNISIKLVPTGHGPEYPYRQDTNALPPADQPPAPATKTPPDKDHEPRP